MVLLTVNQQSSSFDDREDAGDDPLINQEELRTLKRSMRKGKRIFKLRALSSINLRKPSPALLLKRYNSLDEGHAAKARKVSGNKKSIFESTPSFRKNRPIPNWSNLDDMSPERSDDFSLHSSRLQDNQKPNTTKVDDPLINPLLKPLKLESQRSPRVLDDETNRSTERSTEGPKSNRRQFSPSRPKPLRPPSSRSIQSTTSSNGTMSRPQLSQTLKPLSQTSLVEADQDFDKNLTEDLPSNATLSQKQPSQRSVNKDKEEAKKKNNRPQRSSRRSISPTPSMAESAGVSTASVAESSQDVDTSTAGKMSNARSSVFSPPLPSKSESAMESRSRRQRPSVLSKLKKKSKSCASSTGEMKLNDEETFSTKLSALKGPEAASVSHRRGSASSTWSSRSDGLLERRKAALSPRRQKRDSRLDDEETLSAKLSALKGPEAASVSHRRGSGSSTWSSRSDGLLERRKAALSPRRHRNRKRDNIGSPSIIGSPASVGRYRKGGLSDFLDNPSRQQGSNIMQSPNPLRKDKGYISSFLGSSYSAPRRVKQGNHEEYEQSDEDDDEQGMESASLGSNILALGFQALESLYDDCA
jgi:hypothetical protein